MSRDIVSPEQKNEDNSLDTALRPQYWEEYIGQERIKRNLKVLIEAAKKRNDSIEHILLSGPAGLGKTSLAHLIAREMNTNIRVTSGPAIERVGDLASILTNLLAGDILFIDEVHRLPRTVEEVLYPAMEARVLDIIIGKGPSARTIQIDLPPFTLIAATTRVGLLSGPLRSRFGGHYRVEFYTEQEIAKIIARSAKILGINISAGALELLARASRRTPRIANRLLKRARDYAQVYPSSVAKENEILVDERVVKKTLDMLEIDEYGLEPMDRKILEVVIKQFNGGPVGIQTLCAISSEEQDTIEEVYEPYLLQLGLLERTPRGRVATHRAYEYLGLKNSPWYENRQDRLIS